ncbi:MAG: response regulator, partial [Verrucomicrobia bacterium]|nr:response regulator [Verrucomicrobiota bacterium]
MSGRTSASSVESLSLSSNPAGWSVGVLEYWSTTLYPACPQRTAVASPELGMERAMKSPLRVLYLEDDPRDAELVQETLAADGIESEIVRVETESEFVLALKQGGFELVLADYTLPSFDGLSALEIVQKDWPELPLIFVSGTLG